MLILLECNYFNGLEVLRGEISYFKFLRIFCLMGYIKMIREELKEKKKGLWMFRFYFSFLEGNIWE